jgi:methylenetetrahydrofolate reductase (NADPH)
MRIADILARTRPTFSFEFFPPKTPGASEELYQTIQEVMALEPSFVSVTFGAGGTTRALTHDLVVRLTREKKLTVAAHLTSINLSRDEIVSIVERYRDNGVENIMALGGDPPKDAPDQARAGDFRYAAEIVSLIRSRFPSMCIGVAGYPEGHPGTPNRLKEMDYLKAKVDCGADYVCTQLCFNNQDFYDFQERCELAGIRIPVIAGIMPIVSVTTMRRMAELALGMRYPARLLKALARAEDDAHFAKVGMHWATEQVLDLLDHGVRGIHFYTLNKSRATVEIYNALGVTTSSALARRIDAMP